MASTYVGNTKIGNRIAELRVKSNLKQCDLARLLSEMTGRSSVLQPTSISAWETGRRNPASHYITFMSQLFGVTEAYLLCLTNDPKKEEPDYLPTEKPTTDIASLSLSKRIDRETMFAYDGKPVYVSFKNNIHVDQWGIYDDKTKRIVLRSFMIKTNSDSIDAIYTFAPFVITAKSRPIQTLSILLNAETVYLVMRSRDPEVINLYEGWYRHNENKTLLINSAGLTLPYNGLNVSYYAYLM